MRSNSRISYLLAGALAIALSAPALAASEEDAAVPAGSFVSTMAYPGDIPAKQVANVSTRPVKVVRLARSAK